MNIHVERIKGNKERRRGNEKVREGGKGVESERCTMFLQECQFSVTGHWVFSGRMVSSEYVPLVIYGQWSLHV